MQSHLLKTTEVTPGSSDSKASAYNAGDLGSIPGSEISPGEGNGNPLQYSCLENPMDQGVWQATLHGVTKSRTRLSDFTFTFTEVTNYLIPHMCLVAQSCPTLCNLPGSSVHGDSPGKNTGVGCHFLPQEIFLTQGLNTNLQAYSLLLRHLGS